MISSLTGLTTDNKAIFVFNIVTRWGEYWVSTDDTGVAGVDSYALQFGNQSVLFSKVPSAISGGAVDYSTNFELAIVKSDNTLSTSFFNAFYPNTDNVLLGSQITAYITWDSTAVTSTSDFVKLFRGKVVGYNYDEHINLTIERTIEFINNKLPIYSTQTEIDNGIDYVDLVDDTKLNMPLPLLYGSYTAYEYDYHSTGSTSFPNESAVPILPFTEDKLTYKVCSHLTYDSTIAELDNCVLTFNDKLRHYFITDTIELSTYNTTTTKNVNIGGKSFIFDVVSTIDEELFFVGKSRIQFDANGTSTFDAWTNQSSRTRVSIPTTTNRQKNVFTPINLGITSTYGDYLIASIGKPNENIIDYPLYALPDLSTFVGDAYIYAEVQNLSTTTSNQLAIDICDNRNGMSLTPGITPSYITLPASYDGTISLHITDAVQTIINSAFDNVKVEATLSTTTNNYNISLLDIGVSIVAKDTNSADIVIRNIYLRFFNCLIGGDVPTRVGAFTSSRLQELPSTVTLFEPYRL